MSSSFSPWTPPESQPGGAGDADNGSDVRFSAGSPLGGTVPYDAPADEPTDRRELWLTAILLVAAVLTGATSLMPWRDFGRRFGTSATETGWVNADGSMGRGWVIILLAVCLAVAGVLIASERIRAGRILASLTGAGLVVASIVEWGVGAGDVRSGPGTGLWAAMVIGLGVIIAVGSLGPKGEII